MSRRNDLRSINGIVLLDKASGMTSNAALQKVKRILKAQKAGHTGSLDPLASGLLPICLGEATKLSGFLLNTDKRYRVKVRLGIATLTGDSEGEIVETKAVKPLSEDVVEQVLAGFRGEILQVPPMYSALKHQGRRLYDLARQGIEVEREPRRVVIHELKLLGFDSSSLQLDVACSKGTYIRTLAEDVGKALGCGGHVEMLRRTGVGDLSIADSHTLESMETLDESELLGLVLPMDRIVSALPAVQLSDELGFYVRKGQAVLVPKAPKHGWVRLYAKQSVFMGVGEILDDGRVTPRRLVKAVQSDVQELS
ncbi:MULTISPECIES: tRNA pseudouridine(55) synthase TruB [Methylocaldum]|jgi:tRNA pseudouridine55 synthase|uniref:tRNA pseudouridine(55) synthase TruB n=1 Tax=unclassified Methylocaldum TaxID=2622260 RepID=UPI00098B6944|nr:MULTISPECIES: tRNA pseudouridine(55) synthase TruB [unclassified Methylocaldum]MBP1151032.1 tRNA pseudouridine55 synthase [Methylocaldum sp. RMAD-M]MDV3242694.1 tRNA pseudouridine(55) synthase TruB [Methylocaldum sp.]MVF21697.1 tRNA pseudouridine(55) synthase TruB [Methylocaldum sp. BRCS4]